MSSRSTPRARKPSPLISSKSLDHPLLLTTSIRFPDVSVDGQSSPASAPALSKPHLSFADSTQFDADGFKENVTVTVRFRPLSQREIRRGEEIEWYADGDTLVRSEHHPSLAYAYDRVFGPTTTTRHVYDVAAQHVVNGAMEGVNGTIFAYGVTSSGKTHTMHGDEKSSGIIPFAVKDAFNIIQETPNREFLLRVSYLEIYNEVINDLLNPAGQNLKIRGDVQGTFVEGIKEEVVLSPVHALSLIATGEEHRHVGSNNANLVSSRSHTIFTLTIESTPCGECTEGQAVNLSQLNLIDLAGSESSKIETTGVRQKEGSYINKSLLTLGTVMAKLTDGKSVHIPYRDSKLTRLLQSSLSGQGRVSLICTVTPASSNLEETHNTLKFAHRAKHIKIEASQNKIIDEKSLIKKYQYEIRSLKEELEQLKRGIVPVSPVRDMGEVDIDLLKQKLEDGQVNLQSRLEQEEEAKAALLGRIQRLTKLILVSTKATESPRYIRSPGPRRRHSFGEDEFSFLPYKRRDMIFDNEGTDHFGPLKEYDETMDGGYNDEEKTQKHVLLNLFKPGKRENGKMIWTSSDGDRLSGVKSSTAPSTPQAESVNFSVESSITNPLQPGNTLLHSPLDAEYELPEGSFFLQGTSETSMNTSDHIDLLREQLKILSGDVAFHSSVLKRLSDEATNSPKKEQLQLEIRKAKEEIIIKNQQIAALEKQMTDTISETEINKKNFGLSPQSYAHVLEQLNEKSFELEVKIADNRIIQEQLQQKICECEELQEAVTSLKQQLLQALHTKTSRSNSLKLRSIVVNKENTPRDVTTDLREQAHMASEIEELKQKVAQVTESNSQLETLNQKLVEESTYTKGLASAAGVELKALSEEVTKLIKDNERLASEITSLRNSPTGESKIPRLIRKDGQIKPAVTKREANANYQRELLLEAALQEKEQREAELEKHVKESKQKEEFLENELDNMLFLVEKLKNFQGSEPESPDSK